MQVHKSGSLPNIPMDSPGLLWLIYDLKVFLVVVCFGFWLFLGATFSFELVIGETLRCQRLKQGILDANHEFKAVELSLTTTT